MQFLDRSICGYLLSSLSNSIFSNYLTSHRHQITFNILILQPKPRSNSHRRKSKLERLTGYKREQTKVSETATSELMESHSESCHAGQEVKEESVLANDGTGLGTILRTNDISTRMDTTVTPSGTDVSCPQDLDPSVPSSASQTSDSTYPCKSSPMASSAVCASQEGQGVQHKCR